MSALIDWDRLPTETPKSYAAFLAYVALGARRSVREAARQHHVKTASSGPEVTTVKHWLGRLVGAGLTRIQQHIEKTREWNGPSREGAPRRWRSTAS